MDKIASLRQLFLKQRPALRVSNFEILVRDLIGKNFFENSTLEIFFSSFTQERSVQQRLEKERELLGINLILDLKNLKKNYKPQVSIALQALPENPFWQHFQLGQALNQLNRYFADFPTNFPLPFQLESGVAPLETSGYWSWAQVPHHPLHAELGLLWLIIGKLTNSQEMISAAIRLAEWQLNTLDFNYSPFLGLYSQEENLSIAKVLSHNYLLFQAVATLSSHELMQYAAKKQLEQLEFLAERQTIQVPSLLLLVEAWLDLLPKVQRTLPLEKKKNPPPKIYDVHSALVGFRSPDLSLVSTLFGGYTGLGCLHHQDIQIVNYGPQHLPLGECGGFGIETGFLSKSETQPSLFECSENGYVLKSHVRLISKPDHGSVSQGSFQQCKHSGLWLDLSQQFKGNELYLEAMLWGIDALPTIAFSFFIKAQACHVGQSKNMKPRSFDRYQGVLQPVKLEGRSSHLVITPEFASGELQVIPLGGGDNFWGADFLIAYLLSSNSPHYKWRVSLPRHSVTFS